MAKRLYTVRSGDTLSRIARDQLNDLSRWTEIAYINSLGDPYTIFPGQRLILPVDTEELTIDIALQGPDRPEPVYGTAATKTTAFEFAPATLAIAGIAAVAIFMLMGEK